MIANPIVIDQPPQGPTAPPLHITMGGWEFTCEFDVIEPLTPLQFKKEVEAVGNLMAKEFQTTYIDFLYKELRKVNCLKADTIKMYEEYKAEQARVNASSGNGKG